MSTHEATTQQPLLLATDLKKYYPVKKGLFAPERLVKALDGVSFTLERGKTLAVVGESGCGKSTLGRLLTMIEVPTGGELYYQGQDLLKHDPQAQKLRRQKIQIVFQNPYGSLNPRKKVGQILEEPLLINSNLSKEQRREKALDALRQVGLENYAHGYPDELSGGMRQRVGLARALAINPDILLMDEAFSALDPLIRTEMQDELVKLQAKHQRTVVFISHDLDEAMRIGDRIAIMQNGEVVQVGTPDEILNNPANDYVRTFFRGVDISQVFSAKDIARRSPVGLIRKTPGFGPRSALKLLQDEDREFGYVIERGNKFVGIVSIDSLKAALSQAQGIEAALIDESLAVDAQTPLSELLSHVGQAPCAVPVVDEEQQYVGIISKRMLLQALDREGANNG